MTNRKDIAPREWWSELPEAGSGHLDVIREGSGGIEEMSNQFVVPAPLCRVRLEDNGIYLYQPYTDTLHRLPVIYQNLLSQINGVRTVADLENDKTLNTSRCSREMTRRLLFDLISRRFLNLKATKEFQRSLIFEDYRSEGPCFGELSLPLYIYWEPTLRCNLTCDTCYNSSGPKSPSGINALEVAAILAESGAFRVTILGGEPMMMPDFFRVVEILEKANLCVEFVTNGWFLDTENVRKIGKTRIRQIMVSLDGSETTHDKTRGRRGSYRRALAGIRLCTEAGVNVTGSITLMQSNLEELEELICELYDHGVTRFKLRPLVADGRGEDNFKFKGIKSSDVEDYAAVVQRLKQQFKKKVDILHVLGSSRTGLDQDLMPEALAQPESNAIDTLYLRYDGMYCPNSFDRATILGSVTTDSLPRIWEKHIEQCRLNRNEREHVKRVEG